MGDFLPAQKSIRKMKKIIQIEELALLLASIFLFSRLHFSWWWFPLLILTPDLSMAGYLANKKVGAVVYNIFHHKALALGCIFLGIYLGDQTVQLMGIILFGHSSMDRMMGYGLKYYKGFQYTHLGMIGKNK
jgi:hypothetical protein